MIDSIDLRSTNSEWVECLEGGSSPIIFKTLDVKNLSLYWQVGEFETVRNANELSNIFRKETFSHESATSSVVITRSVSRAHMSYVASDQLQRDKHFFLSPLSAKAKLAFNRGSIPTTKNPLLSAHIDFDNLLVTIEDRQYKQLFTLLDLWYDYGKNERVCSHVFVCPLFTVCFVLSSVCSDLLAVRPETQRNGGGMSSRLSRTIPAKRRNSGRGKASRVSATREGNMSLSEER